MVNDLSTNLKTATQAANKLHKLDESLDEWTAFGQLIGALDVMPFRISVLSF
jgi:hypothetical protein